MNKVIKDTKCNSWTEINWSKANRIVNNLQRRIFVAKQQGRFRSVRKLQNLLLSAQSNRYLAVRQVSQLNAGRKTPGIDKKVFLNPCQRWKLAQLLNKSNLNSWKPTPTKRIYISKQYGKLRPLGIPTLADRALQATVKNALEPEWEALFEPSSYGFRKGRSAHDAIRYIHTVCNSRSTKTWIVDADIKGCFDNLCHDFLKAQLKSFPARQVIIRWLKAGYMDKHVFHDSPFGTPQGGVISPLLANIALHGMEECLGINRHKNGRINSPYTLIRYADDFIVACRSEKEAKQAQTKINMWLQSRGLSLSNTKTHITHIRDGFEFLGFNIRLYTSKHKNVLLIKPSKQSQVKLRANLKTTWKSLLGKPVNTVIAKLNPIIKGWANYFKMGASSKVFSSLDHYMWIRQYRYARRTHNKKPWKWIKNKYWGMLTPNRKDRWVFGDKNTGNHMYKFGWTHIKRHVMVKGKSSYYDPSLREYWKTRAIKDTSTFRTAANIKMAKRQNSICPVCSNHLYSSGEPVVLHHLIHQSMGGKNEYNNFMLLHSECHKKVHSLNWNKDILRRRLKVLTGNKS
jgi:RNA-directed DNA polymerase